MKPQPPDPKYQMLDGALPDAVWDLSASSNRPVIKPLCLFFRESKKTFAVPDLIPWDTFGAMRLNQRLYYLWQSDGSLAVYAHLYGGTTSTPDKSYGCLYVRRVHPNDWTLGGAE